MIQRIQSLWLLTASALAFISLQVSFFSGNILVNTVKEFKPFTGRNSVLLTVLVVAVALASLIAVFLYKNRRLQMRVTSAALVVSIINLGLYYKHTQDYVPTDWSFDLTALISLAIPFVLFFATRGIYKDSKLIKSLDRLR
ncbi:DUF4293 family protein [Sediminibacterium soli]|uniref:DUF4293 family protein n=1 Tax=Sediminibacterium soli TaxID=2698829 RepID=UPI00137A45AC|nr:DUF4293 family protein [Sediminibacterium soli]NCI47288.1 DUF4293 domain-containing protein [Sediminibacterium soli]